jgi:acetolactate synthase-1/2/3 large subunit
MVRQWQESFYDKRYSHSNMEKGAPNFGLLANSYGIKSFKFENHENLITNFEEAINFPGPTLIEIMVTEDENCYPMVAPGKSNSQMIGIFKRVPV